MFNPETICFPVVPLVLVVSHANWSKFLPQKLTNHYLVVNENHSTKTIRLKTITGRDLRTSDGLSFEILRPKPARFSVPGRISDQAVRRWSGAWIPCISCPNNNCSITVYFCEDIPVTTKALAREIVKKSQIQKTSGLGINKLVRSDYHVVPFHPRDWFSPVCGPLIRRGPIKRRC